MPRRTHIYNPRNRPWYQAALQGDRVRWTDVYVFFTDRKPGGYEIHLDRELERMLLMVLRLKGLRRTAERRDRSFQKEELKHLVEEECESCARS